MDQPQSILGIDPGTREMGTAVIRGTRLLHAGVHTLRNGTRPYDLVGQAQRVVLGLIRDFTPQLVVIEKPLLLPTKRAALVSVISQELLTRGAELGCCVLEMDARSARQRVVGNPAATKLNVARVIVRDHFPLLEPKLPTPPARAALGFAPKDRYWLHMFDALALCLAVRGPRCANPLD
jgi:Holliday junction resolvasome RuvABC endonuclease subunit